MRKCHNFCMVPPKFWWKNRPPFVIIIRLAARLEWKWGTYQFWFLSILFRRNLARALLKIYFLVLVLSLSLLQSKFAPFHVTFTILCQFIIWNYPRITEEFRYNSKRIPKEFPKNSHRIPKEFPKEFSENLQRTPQKVEIFFSKNSQRILK